MKPEGFHRAVRNVAFICGIICLFTIAGCISFKDGLKKVLRGHLDPAKLNTGLPVITIRTHTGQPVTSREYTSMRT
jgi:hypothetical protein